MLKRIGAGGIGIAALAGSASGNDVQFDGEVVVENGNRYVYKAGVDPDVVATDDCCCSGLNGCDATCDCCWENCAMK